MNQLVTMRQLIKALYCFREMPAGQGWVSPATLRDYSGVSHSTTYRYLPKLEKLGFIETKQVIVRGMKCKQYRVTPEGIEYVGHHRVFM